MLRTFLATITLAAPAMTVAPLPSHAQSDYPNRIVKIVVPYAAGTVPDILVRGLTPGLSGRLGQQFIVENKTGGSGALGTASVARAEADGYTVLFAPAVVLSVLPQSRNDTGYRPDSLVPVCQTFVNTMGLAVRPESPIKSIGDLVAAAKQKPGALNYGHPGVMTIPHLAVEEFMQAAAIDIKDIPFRSGPQTIAELLAGRIDMLSIVIGRSRPEHPDHRCVRREAPSPPPRRADRQGARLRSQSRELRRLASAECNSSADLVQALLGMCRSGKERSVCDDRQECRPTRRLFRRRGGVRAASRARHRQQGARAVASQDTIEEPHCLRRIR